ncbi:hypothetical protein PYCC9005_005186 [Savitreella phatthalungensis]
MDDRGEGTSRQPYTRTETSQPGPVDQAMSTGSEGTPGRLDWIEALEGGPRLTNFRKQVWSWWEEWLEDQELQEVITPDKPPTGRQLLEFMAVLAARMEGNPKQPYIQGKPDRRPSIDTVKEILGAILKCLQSWARGEAQDALLHWNLKMQGAVNIMSRLRDFDLISLGTDRECLNLYGTDYLEMMLAGFKIQFNSQLHDWGEFVAKASVLSIGYMTAAHADEILYDREDAEPSTRPKDLPTMRWRDIQFLLPLSEDSGFRALISFEHSRGKKRTVAIEQTREGPYAAIDPVSILLAHAFRQKVFQDFKREEPGEHPFDWLKRNVLATGSILRIRPEARDRPVFATDSGFPQDTRFADAALSMFLDAAGIVQDLNYMDMRRGAASCWRHIRNIVPGYLEMVDTTEKAAHKLMQAGKGIKVTEHNIPRPPKRISALFDSKQDDYEYRYISLVACLNASYCRRIKFLSQFVDDALPSTMPSVRKVERLRFLDDIRAVLVTHHSASEIPAKSILLTAVEGERAFMELPADFDQMRLAGRKTAEQARQDAPAHQRKDAPEIDTRATDACDDDLEGQRFYYDDQNREDPVSYNQFVELACGNFDEISKTGSKGNPIINDRQLVKVLATATRHINSPTAPTRYVCTRCKFSATSVGLICCHLRESCPTSRDAVLPVQREPNMDDRSSKASEPQGNLGSADQEAGDAKRRRLG